ncbi:MAG: hypothetical protein KC561_09800, partial [Myxococcales bacterium]|nr:hypothetical protein [Myxococcales bacterium]
MARLTLMSNRLDPIINSANCSLDEFLRSVAEALALVRAEESPALSRGRLLRPHLLSEDGKVVPSGLFCPKVFGDKLDETVVLHVPTGFVHPRLAPAIASVLGWEEDFVWQVARGEEPSPSGEVGPEAIGHALEQLPEGAVWHAAPDFRVRDLLLVVLPVPAPNRRPYELLVDSTDPLAEVPSVEFDPINHPLRLAVGHIARLSRFVELGTVDILRRNEAIQVQRAIDAVFATVAGRGGNQVLKSAPVVHMWQPGSEDPSEAGPVQAVVWLTADEILVQDGAFCRVLAVTSDREISHFEVPAGFRAITCDTRGEIVLFHEGFPQAWTADGSHDGNEECHIGTVGALVWRHGTWLSSYPHELEPAIVWGDQPEDAFLVNAATNTHVRVMSNSDRPVASAYSRGARLVLVTDGGGIGQVWRTSSAKLLAAREEPRDDVPFLTLAGRLVPVENPEWKDMADAWCECRGAAVEIVRDQLALVHCEG